MTFWLSNKRQHFSIPKLPGRVYCDGQTYKEPIPDFPETYSFTEEIIARNSSYSMTAGVSYSYKLKTVRYDLLGFKRMGPAFVDAPLKYIHDFNSGNFNTNKFSK